MDNVDVVDLTVESEEEEVTQSHADDDDDVEDVSRSQWISSHGNRNIVLRSVLTEPFAGMTVVLPRADALKEALREYTPGYRERGPIFWTDGSKQLLSAGTAVVYRKQHNIPIWTKKGWTIHGRADNNDVELYGVAEAMKIAVRMCKDTKMSANPFSDRTISTVTIYTDSVTTIDAIDQFHLLPPPRQAKIERQAEIAKIRERTLKLRSMGIMVLLKWVPAHSGVEGNSRADHEAHRAARGRYQRMGDFVEEMIPQEQQRYTQEDTKRVVVRNTRKRQRHLAPGERMNRFKKLERLEKTSGSTSETRGPRAG